MSCFGFVSFPRKVDTTVLENEVITLESYKIGELMLSRDGIGVNPNTDSDLVSCDKLVKEFGFFHGFRLFEPDMDVTFKECFKNEHIYCFEGNLNYNGAVDLLDNKSEFVIGMLKHTIIDIELCRKQLRDLMIYNLQKGEFIEFYFEFGNHVDFDFGPPLREICLGIDEILFSNELRIEDHLRIEIRL